MERGDGHWLAVLSIVLVIGTLATASLFLTSPSGQIAQGQPVYPTDSDSGIICDGFAQPYRISTTRIQSTFCCPEDMIGQNTCRYPYHVINQ